MADTPGLVQANLQDAPNPAFRIVGRILRVGDDQTEIWGIHGLGGRRRVKRVDSGRQKEGWTEGMEV